MMRGVISEGADFSGAACRTVIVVGVPLPPLLDLGIRLKRQYQVRIRGMSACIY